MTGIESGPPENGGAGPYGYAFIARCATCVHGYDENDSDCAACLAGCDMGRHYRQREASWVDEYDPDSYREEWD